MEGSRFGKNGGKARGCKLDEEVGEMDEKRLGGEKILKKKKTWTLFTVLVPLINVGHSPRESVLVSCTNCNIVWNVSRKRLTTKRNRPER